MRRRFVVVLRAEAETVSLAPALSWRFVAALAEAETVSVAPALSWRFVVVLRAAAETMSLAAALSWRFVAVLADAETVWPGPRAAGSIHALQICERCNRPQARPPREWERRAGRADDVASRRSWFRARDFSRHT